MKQYLVTAAIAAIAGALGAFLVLILVRSVEGTLDAHWLEFTGAILGAVATVVAILLANAHSTNLERSKSADRQTAQLRTLHDWCWVAGHNSWNLEMALRHSGSSAGSENAMRAALMMGLVRVAGPIKDILQNISLPDPLLFRVLLQFAEHSTATNQIRSDLVASGLSKLDENRLRTAIANLIGSYRQNRQHAMICCIVIRRHFPNGNLPVAPFIPSAAEGEKLTRAGAAASDAENPFPLVDVIDSNPPSNNL